jgi:hypothetical protein
MSNFKYQKQYDWAKANPRRKKAKEFMSWLGFAASFCSHIEAGMIESCAEDIDKIIAKEEKI